MAEQIILRPPKVDELDVFYSVFLTGLPGVDQISYEDFSRMWNQALGTGDLLRLWRVAVDRDQIVGVVVNVVNEHLRWGIIWELAVLPEMRNKGIGRGLIHESERLMKELYPNITYFALGVKTNNTRALSLYEQLGYRIRFLVLHLRGRVWRPERRPRLRVEHGTPDMAERLGCLEPDAYWGARGTGSWRKGIRREHLVLMTPGARIVAVVIPLPSETTSCTEVPFYIRPGFGPTVMDAVMDLINTEEVDFWVQDNHQDILDHLYDRGLRTIDAEYLMKRPVVTTYT